MTGDRRASSEVPTTSTNSAHKPSTSRLKTKLGIMLHGISVDGIIERIEGNPEFAETEVVRLRAQGQAVEYVFGARTEDDFCQKKDQTEKQRLALRL